jgi:trans-aconitate methyltransferase
MNVPDHNADHYTKYSSLQNGHAKDILSTVHLDPEASVLDVGCGDGKITAELAMRAIKGSVVGLDASSSMIESASIHFPEDQFPNLHFQLQPIEDAVFLHPFNLITSFSCFHWLKEPKKVMQKLISCLKEGGELLILTYPKESPYYQYMERALEKYPEYKHLSSNHTMLSSRAYKDFFLENHLKILKFEEETILATYNSVDEIFNFIKGWVSNYVPIPSDLQDQFINDVIQAILDDKTTQKDSMIKVPYTALTMKVQK